jgi:hypothetical protein
VDIPPFGKALISTAANGLKLLPILGLTVTYCLYQWPLDSQKGSYGATKRNKC